MTEFIAIAPESHAKKVWKNVPDYAFAAADTVIPLMGAEISKTISAMPIGFIKKEVGYQLVGITSLQAGMNMYVAPDGKWLTGYIPTALRAYPFGLAESDEGPDKVILCINEASGLVVESTEDGNAFFDDQNQPTQKIKDIINLLSDFRVNLAVTQRAVNALDDAGLITPWVLKNQLGEEVVPVAGLCTIDEAALNKLDDDDFLALRKANGFAVAYAQLLSVNQLTMLEGLGRMRTQTDNSKATTLTGVSLIEENGSLVFD